MIPPTSGPVRADVVRDLATELGRSTESADKRRQIVACMDATRGTRWDIAPGARDDGVAVVDRAVELVLGDEIANDERAVRAVIVLLTSWDLRSWKEREAFLVHLMHVLGALRELGRRELVRDAALLDDVPDPGQPTWWQEAIAERGIEDLETMSSILRGTQTGTWRFSGLSEAEVVAYVAALNALTQPRALTGRGALAVLAEIGQAERIAKTDVSRHLKEIGDLNEIRTQVSAGLRLGRLAARVRACRDLTGELPREIEEVVEADDMLRDPLSGGRFAYVCEDDGAWVMVSGSGIGDWRGLKGRGGSRAGLEFRSLALFIPTD
jgi:hypothetical protein